MKYLFSFFGFLLAVFTFSQTKNDLKILKIDYQKCLDKGAAMHICAYNFYAFSDELLNKSYQKYRSQLNVRGQNDLKKNQKIWLKKRDSVLNKNYLDLKKENFFTEDTQDFKMMLNDKNAKFVLKRVEFLIDKIQ